MHGFDAGFVEEIEERPPNTLVVLLLIGLAALTFSYLGSFAIPDALVQQHVLAPWPADSDPRPGWMMHSFVFLLVTFIFLAATVRFLIHRQLKRIEAMKED